MDTHTTALSAHIREIFTGDPWYGDNICNKLSAITAPQADWQPYPGANTIAQVLRHMLSWKLFVIQKLENNDPTIEIHMNTPEDWDKSFTVATPDGWNALVAQFIAANKRLLSVLHTRTDEELLQQVSNRNYNMHYLANGIYEHDIYHIAQIGYIHSLWSKAKHNTK